MFLSPFVSFVLCRMGVVVVACRNKDGVSSDVLDGVKLLVFGAPTEPFDGSEVCVCCFGCVPRVKRFHVCLVGRFCQASAVRDYLTKGGSVLLLGHESGGTEEKTDRPFVPAYLQKLLHGWGLGFNSDSLVRTVYAREYFHPKVGVGGVCVCVGYLLHVLLLAFFDMCSGSPGGAHSRHVCL